MAKATTKRRRRSSGRSTSKQGGMAPWYLAAALTLGGVMAYDHRAELRHWPVVSDVMAFASRSETKPKPQRAVPEAQERVAQQADRHKPNPKPNPATKVVLAAPVPSVNVGVTPPTPLVRPNEEVKTASIRTDQFYFCGIRNDNCVIDGATFVFHGETIRVADVDAPRDPPGKLRQGAFARLLRQAAPARIAECRRLQADLGGRAIRCQGRRETAPGHTR
ncbi:hypothetical protein ACU4I5_10105 [Ensifer adhaerens]